MIMAVSKNLLFLVSILSCSLLTAGNLPVNSSKIIQWVRVTNDELPQRDLPFVGVENGAKVYLAQATQVDEFKNEVYKLPGKLTFGDIIKATIVLDGMEHTFLEFLVLDAPQEVLSWIPMEPKEPISDQAIIGGIEGDGKLCYVCRAQHKENIIPGWLSKKGAVCNYGFNGTAHKSSDTFEILVINQLGLAMGMTFWYLVPVDDDK